MPTAQQLREEILTDPSALGFEAMRTAGNDVGLAAALNLSRVGAAFAIDREWVEAYEIINCFDATEFAALTQIQVSRLAVMLSGGRINAMKPNVRAILAAIFPPGGPTRIALLAMQSRQGSRCEKLWGDGVAVSVDQVADARGDAW